MKRTIRTLAAAAMAGAIAISVTPAADAQTETEIAAAYAQLDKLVQADLPKQLTDGEGNYYQLVDGGYVKTELPAGAENVPVIGATADGNLQITFPDGSRDAIVIPVQGVADGSAEGTVEVPAPEQPQGPGNTLTLDPPAPAPEGDAAPVAEPAPEGEADVEGEAGAGAGAEGEADAEGEAGAGAGSSNGAAGEVNAELSPGAIAGIAAAAIGIPVVIAGVTYFLNQDGETLVGSSDRVNKQPTPEEKAKSDQLRAEHADEIAAQQVAAAANRGVEAETGSNTIARTLFALVIASVLGAAAFVAGRRFLV
ncbi:hypothetical protein NUW87_08075 [Corynebacterium pilbarense]|uniref:Uncharacterized protein n=1 Tax=Corynebacterium pilbarense TaxID=1288393 RepID=A0A9Q4IHP7_9CORY|nr:hypothetical protein [Corynebacterium pilbarense]MCZ2221327.1 hypothetical protein [Corynebacterium pilbarense]